MRVNAKSWHSQGNFGCQGKDASLRRQMESLKREQCKGKSMYSLMFILDAQDISDASVCH